MTTAAPVALALGGRKTVRVGLWTLVTLYSPLFWTSRVSFSSLRLSNPGGPFSQSGTSSGSSARSGAGERRHRTATATESGRMERSPRLAYPERREERWETMEMVYGLLRANYRPRQ